MKISILGYCGSGKSTLARLLGVKYGADVLHFDAIHWLPGWEPNSRDEKLRLTEDFLNTRSSWVIDGNYDKYFFERRLEESDMIILMLFNRFACLVRVINRHITYKGKTRPDIGAGCDEKLDWAFIKWVLIGQRSKASASSLKISEKLFFEKVTVIKNQRQLDEFYKQNELSAP